MWDGKTEIDAVGMALNTTAKEIEDTEAEKNMTREEWELTQQRKAAEQDTQTGTLNFSASLTTSQQARARQMQEEKANIKAKAIADGTFMKAPNGAATHLTEDQWLTVRTSAFKDWFGDWQNDPANASKVVDENGEPLVVYHTTNAVFTEFRETQKSDAGWLGAGFYFYGIRRRDGGYGRNLMEVFLNIRHPYIATFDDWSHLSEMNDKELSREYTNQVLDSGGDGVYFNEHGNQEWMATTPNQIKSATDNIGTFDKNSDNITFSVSPSLADDIHKAYNRRLKSKEIIPLCTCPRVFSKLGLPQADIVTEANVITKLRNKHNLSEKEIIQAIHGLDDPQQIFQDSTSDDIIIFPGMQAKNRVGSMGEVMAPIKLERAKDGKHFMASLYPLDSPQKMEAMLKAGKLLYDKKEALRSADSNAPGLSPDLLRLPVEEGFQANTSTKENVDKEENQKNLPGTSSSFSVTSPQAQSMFKDGMLFASNGVVFNPLDASFSITGLMHASKYLFDKFMLEKVGSGEGYQIFGYGHYFASTKRTNRKYVRDNTKKGKKSI